MNTRHLILGALFPLLIAAVFPLPAGAGEKPKVNCICKANQQNFHVGDVICLRGVLAQCVMAQNVTSWEVTKDPCPSAKAPMSVPDKQWALAFATEAITVTH
ncbi:hypothetical protein [Pannonibacter phragmitetus]|uniref:hypothetical protein n=1 Tax=Pannonibacter phragmitetus TaxID=121719 RepID=UPI003D2F0086